MYCIWVSQSGCANKRTVTTPSGCGFDVSLPKPLTAACSARTSLTAFDGCAVSNSWVAVSALLAAPRSKVELVPKVILCPFEACFDADEVGTQLVSFA